MQVHNDPGLETYGRLWEDEPRGGWHAFLAAKRQHLMRIAGESDRSDDEGAPFPVEWSSLHRLDGEG